MNITVKKSKKCERKKRCNSGEVFNEQLEKCTSSQSQSSWTKKCKTNEYYSQKTKKCEYVLMEKLIEMEYVGINVEPIKLFKMVNV